MKKIPAPIDDKNVMAEWDWLSDNYMEDHIGSAYTVLFFDNHIPWIMEYTFGANTMQLHQIGKQFNSDSFRNVFSKIAATNEDTDCHLVTAEIAISTHNHISVSYWYIMDE